MKLAIQKILLNPMGSPKPYYRKDIVCLESIQRRATELVQGFSNLSFQECLQRLDLFPLEYRRTRGDLIEIYKILHGYDKIQSSFFQRTTKTHLQGHNLKLFKQQNRLLLRSNFFTQRVITTWNHLPQELVNAPSISSFKTRFDATRSGRLATLANS
jgi:hypothetical protein